jgi:aminopeptidase N
MNANGINNDKTEIYNIPISLAVDGSGFENPLTQRYYFTQSSEEFTLDKTPEDYYMLNVQQTGFYRVHYSDENWQKIGEALAQEDSREKIHVLNRAQVVDDLLHLARVGIVEYSKAINIVRFLKNETDYIPWYAAINQGFLYLSYRLESKDVKIFSWFINDLMENVYKHLTFEPKSDDARVDIYNRVNILTWLCKFGHEECKEKTKKAFADYVETNKKVPKDHRILVYCNAIRYGGDAEFDFLFNRLMMENVAQEQLNILNALGCSKDEKNIKVSFANF